MGAQGIATLDFGSTPSETASVVITGQAGILSGSLVEPWVMRGSTADNGADAHEELALMFMLIAGDIVAGTGFTIRARSIFGLKATGTFQIPWGWN